MKVLKYKDKEGNYQSTYSIYESPEAQFNGYDYVDMGEAGYWATCNIGANSPEEYGLYFQWGDTKGYIDSCSEEESDSSENKHYFDWSKYKFGTSSNLTKYYSFDDFTTLELKDDAAHVNMGGKWRMPTLNEQRKLRELCDTEWINDYNGTGIKGRLFTLKTDESKQLFFPASGYKVMDTSYIISQASFIWSSSLKDDETTSEDIKAISMSVNSVRVGSSEDDRCFGCVIRGFIPKSE